MRRAVSQPDNYAPVLGEIVVGLQIEHRRQSDSNGRVRRMDQVGQRVRFGPNKRRVARVFLPAESAFIKY